MSIDVVQSLETLRKQIQDKKVEYATLKTREDELQRQMTDLQQQSKDEFGIDADQLDNDIGTLDSTIEKGIAEVTESLKGKTS